MNRSSSPPRGKESIGEYSLATGIVAVLCAFIPIIGDFISLPTAVLALALGLTGIHFYRTGRSKSVAPARAGTVLGIFALFVVALVFAVTHLVG